MNFQLTEEQIAVQLAARDFARTELLPGVIERDEKQKFPAEQIKKLGELGFLGMMVDPKYGGSGMDTISYVLAMEEISKIDASVSVCMSVNNYNRIQMVWLAAVGKPTMLYSNAGVLWHILSPYTILG